MATTTVTVLLIIQAIFTANGQSQCGGSLAVSGSFSSPNFPGFYPSNQVCTWVLTASPGKAVQLNVLSLETSTYDPVEVYSGGVLIFRLINYQNSNSYVLSRNVTLIFRASQPAPGFSMSFTSEDPACGQFCFAQFCSLWTPAFPERYPKAAGCVWSTTSQYRGKIQLLDFRVTNPNPVYGNVSILSTTRGAVTTNEIYVNSLPLSLVVGDVLSVEFVSGGCFRGTGFLASTTVVNNVCTASLSNQGSLRTPGYPLSYPALAGCIYTLTATAGKTLSVTLSINLEPNYDFLSVFSDGLFYASYTGLYSSLTLALGRTATFEFTSDDSVSRSGVALTFFSV